MIAFSARSRIIATSVLVGLLLLLGSYLRLYNIEGYMTFLGDEGRDVMVVKRMIVDRKFTLLGPTASVGGFFLGPIYYYFMLPFLWAWNLDPVGPAVMVALFGIATILLMYHVGRSFFGTLAGLVSASLYAVSPIVIAYSRSSWNPNLVPFFSLFLVYILWRIVVYNRWKELFWVGIILGIGIQLHYLFVFLYAVVGVWVFIHGRKKELLRYYLYGLIGFLIGNAPFLAFELRHGFPNTQSIIRFILEGKDTGFESMQFFPTIHDVLERVFGRLVLRLPQEGIWNSYEDWQITDWLLGTWGFILTSVGVLIAIIARRVPRIDRKLPLLSHIDSTKHAAVAAQLLLIWGATVLILFGFYRRGIYDYYFGIFFGLPFLCLGAIVWALSKTYLRTSFLILICLGLLYLNWQGRPFLHPPNNQLAQAKRIAMEAMSKADGKPYNFAFVTEQNSDHVFRYFFDVWGNPPVTIQNEAIDPERKTVTDQLIVICENIQCQPLGHPLWEIAGFGKATIEGYWDVPFVRIYKLVRYNEQTEESQK